MGTCISFCQVLRDITNQSTDWLTYFQLNPACEIIQLTWIWAGNLIHGWTVVVACPGHRCILCSWEGVRGFRLCQGVGCGGLSLWMENLLLDFSPQVGAGLFLVSPQSWGWPIINHMCQQTRLRNLALRTTSTNLAFSLTGQFFKFFSGLWCF